MDFAQQLQLLQAADRDPAKLALATVDLILSGRPEEERNNVREALEAVAIPHWFDEKIVAALLEISEADAVVRMVRLRELNVVEPFPARGSGAMNVHEGVRAELRARLAAVDDKRLRAFSARARSHFVKSGLAASEIEALYHQFTCDPTGAAWDCGTLWERWFHTGQYEAQFALGTALEEFLGPDRQALPAGLVRGSALFHLGRIRFIYPRLEDSLETTAALARAARENYLLTEVDWRIAMARGLLGEVLADQNDFDAALIELRAALEIRKARAKANAADQYEQRNLSVVHNKVGETLRKKGDLAEALAEFRDGLAVLEKIAKSAPDLENLPRDRSVSHERIGDVLHAQRDFSGALNAHRNALAIRERLVDQEPGNALWQRDVSVSREKIADALAAQDNLPGALADYRKSLAIREALATRYPKNAESQTDLANSCGKVAEVLLRLAGDQSEAQRLITRGQAIMSALARSHPLTPHEQYMRDALEKWEAVAGRKQPLPPL